jgi:hypothetical protein
MHVDEFIEFHFGDKYARWILLHFRLPAILQCDFNDFIKDKKLFCTFENKRYRCTGASRMGDVWITDDFNKSSGYQKRVLVDDCYEWGPLP